MAALPKLGRVVDVEPEDVVGTVEGSVLGLQHEHLRVRVWGILVALQSAKDTDQHAAVQHGLRVDRCDDSVQFLEAQRLQEKKKLSLAIVNAPVTSFARWVYLEFLENLFSTLHLGTLEGHERGLWLQRDE